MEKIRTYHQVHSQVTIVEIQVQVMGEVIDRIIVWHETLVGYPVEPIKACNLALRQKEKDNDNMLNVRDNMFNHPQLLRPSQIDIMTMEAYLRG